MFYGLGTWTAKSRASCLDPNLATQSTHKCCISGRYSCLHASYNLLPSGWAGQVLKKLKSAVCVMEASVSMTYPMLSLNKISPRLTSS